MVDLRRWIARDDAVREGGFSGAVFFTYSLNLSFFEQIVSPALDQAGCANVLIVTDPDGYNGALTLGARMLQGAGKRYVVTPLQRPGSGIQHAKLLLMIGPQHARLMIGSANLTLPGYGRNLELVSLYAYDVGSSGGDDRYPFLVAWQLIQTLNKSDLLPTGAQRQLAAMAENVTWLQEDVQAPETFRVWHNHDTPILSQLQTWRAEHLPAAKPLKLLRVISPYYDEDAETLRRLVDNLTPASLQVCLDPAATNLSGNRLQRTLSGRAETLQVLSVLGQTKKGASRSLHAKAIIGVEDGGAWCLSGSANISRPALARSWLGGGNLELVTFNWSPDSAAFDHILDEKGMVVEQIDIDELTGGSKDPSEGLEPVSRGCFIQEATAHGTDLHLRLSECPSQDVNAAVLRFFRTQHTLDVNGTKGLVIDVELAAPLSSAEAVRLEMGAIITPYRWIDQPEALARFGARSYHYRIKGQIETFDGAGKLFEELLNYLWQRVDPQRWRQEESDEEGLLGRSRKVVRRSDGDDATGPEPPPAEAFITEEKLIATVHWAIDGQRPYDRSVMGLRDLLSLVLLRLTTPTEEPEPGEGQEESISSETRRLEREQKRVQAEESLRRYVLDYCRRYGMRLADDGFVRGVGAGLLFQNHFTLGRVLLELERKSELFTRKDLRTCFWYLWAPLVLPRKVGLSGQATLEVLEKGLGAAPVAESWRQMGLAGMTALVLTRSLGEPSRNDDPSRVAAFLVGRELLRQLARWLGEDALHCSASDLAEARGLDGIQDIYTESPGTPNGFNPDAVRGLLKRIEDYHPPVEERLLPLVRLSDCDRSLKLTSEQRVALINEVRAAGLETELQNYEHFRKPLRPIVGGTEYCPGCHARLPIKTLQDLRHGNLVLCSVSKDAWLYVSPSLPNTVL